MLSVNQIAGFSKVEFLEKEGNYEVDRLYVGRHPQKHQVDLDISDGHRQAYTGFFFNCYLAAPRPTLGHYRGGSLTHPMLITCVLHIQPKGHRQPRNEVGSLSSGKHLVGFEWGTFWFWSQLMPKCFQNDKLVISEDWCNAFMKQLRQ